VQVVKTRSGQLAYEPLVHPEAVLSVSISPNGQILGICGGNAVRLWRIHTALENTLSTLPIRCNRNPQASIR
jgi:hypothetical protein